jgi:methionyl-tRNA formyltransferase
MSLRVLIVGQEAAGAQILRMLATSEHRVVAVLTQEPKTQGESSSLASAATRAGLSVLPAELVKDSGFAVRVREWKVDLLLNVHSLHVVSGDVLAAPRIGAFNLHPGPLPSYAGLNTPAWAIYNGETEFGVTVHWMQPEIDTGPIVFEERFAVPPNATALSLAAECTRRGVALLGRLVASAEDGVHAIPRVPQDLSARVYYARNRIPQAGSIDWHRPAEDVARFVRAFDYGPFASPWGRPVAVIAERRVGVLGLEPTGVTASSPPGTHRLVDGSLELACVDEWIAVRHVFDDGVLMTRDRVADWIRAGAVGEAGSRSTRTTSHGANI